METGAVVAKNNISARASHPQSLVGSDGRKAQFVVSVKFLDEVLGFWRGWQGVYNTRGQLSLNNGLGPPLGSAGGSPAEDPFTQEERAGVS